MTDNTPDSPPEKKPAADPLTLALKKPIQAHGETVSTLKFREPTGEDIMSCGYPTIVKTEPGSKKIEIAVDAANTGALISTLAGIPPSSVKAMHYNDFTKAGAIVAGFFKDSIAGIL